MEGWKDFGTMSNPGTMTTPAGGQVDEGRRMKEEERKSGRMEEKEKGRLMIEEINM